MLPFEKNAGNVVHHRSITPLHNFLKAPRRKIKTALNKWYICYLVHHTLLSTLRWRHNDHAGVSNHQPHGCLLNRLFRRKSKKTSKLRVTGLCAGNSPGTGEFPAQMASYAENVSIWWRHHANFYLCVSQCHWEQIVKCVVFLCALRYTNVTSTSCIPDTFVSSAT